MERNQRTVISVLRTSSHTHIYTHTHIHSPSETRRSFTIRANTSAKRKLGPTAKVNQLPMAPRLVQTTRKIVFFLRYAIHSRLFVSLGLRTDTFLVRDILSVLGKQVSYTWYDLPRNNCFVSSVLVSCFLFCNCGDETIQFWRRNILAKTEKKQQWFSPLQPQKNAIQN